MLVLSTVNLNLDRGASRRQAAPRRRAGQHAAAGSSSPAAPLHGNFKIIPECDFRLTTFLRVTKITATFGRFFVSGFTKVVNHV